MADSYDQTSEQPSGGSKRLMVILLIVLGLALIGAGVYWYFNQETVNNLFSGNGSNTNTTTNTTTNANTETPTVNAALPNELEGTDEIDATVTVNEVPVHFSSVSKLDAFEGEGAEEGNAFIVVYFDALEGSQVLTVQRGLASLASLRYNGGNANASSIKVASNVIEGDRGYIKFQIPAAATNLSVLIGEGGEQFALPL